MPKRTTELYLQDILDCVRRISSYSKGFSFRDLQLEAMAADAIVRNIEVIGEASRHIPADFKKKHASIPWADMVAMRNKCIHEYFGVDLEILWKTIKDDLPPIQKVIKKLIH